MNTTIKSISVQDLENDSDILALLAAYAEESSIDGMPPTNPQISFYKQLESTGVLKAFAAYEDDTLIGFLFLLWSFIPHYGVKIASTESYYVLPSYRKSGAGMKLLRQAEQCAAEIGCAGFFVSAPFDGKLAQVMEAMPHYRETNRVFFRGIAHV
jgi:GNAT superfamily N-acetyltransferase